LPIHVKLVYYGQARDAAGTREEDFTLPERASVNLLLDKSLKAHGKLEKIRGIMKVAVNEELAEKSQVLRDGDTVALLPPVAGG
jgi:molybdopterin converting factor subunit 1